ncbi:MAG: hypothetical protein IJT51_10730 [Bacteroidales bacterium]|nr:hypothetical protein [Bacteroidales bacterium]
MKNLEKLFRQYFITYWKRDLTYFGVIAALALISVWWGSGFMSSAKAVAGFLMIYYAARSFIELSRSNKAINYMMIPAEPHEKVTSKLLLANVYFVAGCLISLIAGGAMGYLFLYISEPSNSISFTLFEDIFNTYTSNLIINIFAFISIFFFTSIYFKGKNIVKTVLIMAGLGFLGFAMSFLTIYINFKAITPARMLFAGANLGDIHYPEELVSKVTEIAHYAINIGIMIYFYTLSYIRFKETEA